MTRKTQEHIEELTRMWKRDEIDKWGFYPEIERLIRTGRCTYKSAQEIIDQMIEMGAGTGSGSKDVLKMRVGDMSGVWGGWISHADRKAQVIAEEAEAQTKRYFRGDFYNGELIGIAEGKVITAGEGVLDRQGRPWMAVRGNWFSEQCPLGEYGDNPYHDVHEIDYDEYRRIMAGIEYVNRDYLM